MTETDTNTETELQISREHLKSKPVDQWTPAEEDAGREMTHTLGVSLYNSRRLAEHGSKGMSWDSILGQALDKLEEDQS